MRKTKIAWTVSINTDLTEGRGHYYIKYICTLEATARRLAKGADTQGTNGVVKPITLEFRKEDGLWLGPVITIEPTPDDCQAEGNLKRRREIAEKARGLGLSDDEIDLLRKL